MVDRLSVFIEKELLWNLNRIDRLLDLLFIMLLENLRKLIFFWIPLGLKISESKLFSCRVKSMLRIGFKKDKHTKIREVVKSNSINFLFLLPLRNWFGQYFGRIILYFEWEILRTLSQADTIISITLDKLFLWVYLLSFFLLLYPLLISEVWFLNGIAENPPVLIRLAFFLS